MKRSITIDGTGTNGYVTLADVWALLEKEPKAGQAEVKARTSLGGWVKSITVTVTSETSAL